MPSDRSGGLDELSTGVRELLTAVHGRPRVTPDDRVVRRSSVDTTAELRDVALGKRDVARGLRARALVELARFAPEDVADEVLRSVAEDDREPSEIRVAAAAAVRSLPPAEAERASLALLDATDDGVRAAAAATLGRVGGVEAFEALGPLADADRGSLGRPDTFPDTRSHRAAFARAVVAHRLRRPDAPRFDVVGADRADLREGVRVEVDRPSREEREAIPKSAFGVALAADRAVALGDDGTRRRPVLVPAVDVADDPASELRERPALFAVVLDYTDEREAYTPVLLGFGDPVDDGVQVTFCRPGGRAMWAGTGTATDGSVGMRLSDTGLLGTAPTRLTISFDADGFHLSEGVVAPAERRVRRPEPLGE